MIEAVLFDVDGVLVHPWRFRDRLIAKHGITPEMTAPFFRGAFEACLLGQADVLQTLPPFLATWGWKDTPSAFLDEWLATEHAPHEAVLATVAALRRGGMRCFVASTQEGHRARYLEADMGFERLFDGLFFSCDLGSAKPRQAFYTTVAHLLECDASRLLLFDDAMANVEGARAAGWRAELFTTVERLDVDLAAHGLAIGGNASS